MKLRVRKPVKDDPTPVFRTQAALNSANALANRIAEKNKLMIAGSAYAGRKVGDPIPKFVDPSGKPLVPIPVKPKPTTVPDSVSIDDIYQDNQGGYRYDDPKTGDSIEIDASVLNLPRMKKSKTQVQNDQSQRMYAKK